MSSAAGAMRGGAIQLVALAKSFGGVPAVNGIDLDIGAGEFFSLLGASGCGKTTTLRMIAGFEKPDAGQIVLDGRDLSRDAPHVRPVNTVFQNYALFPFMSVHDNVAFGLRYQKRSKAEVRSKVGAALELTRMSAFAGRRPGQLSGGQQQRVALARALVLEPRVLLLDEPLGALDAQLRKALQRELRALHDEVGITFVYVTHDQEEALTMSDRIAVLAEGHVEQVGAPEQIYAMPATTYVAGFLGSANIFDADVVSVSGTTATCSVFGVPVHASLVDTVDTVDTGRTVDTDRTVDTGLAAVVIRPERIAIAGPDEHVAAGHNVLRGVVQGMVYLGASTQVHVELAPGALLTVEIANHNGPSSVPFAPGARVQCVCSPDAVRVLRRSSATFQLDPVAAPA